MEGGYTFLLQSNILLFEIGSVVMKANGSHYYILFQCDQYQSLIYTILYFSLQTEVKKECIGSKGQNLQVF